MGEDAGRKRQPLVRQPETAASSEQAPQADASQTRFTSDGPIPPVAADAQIAPRPTASELAFDGPGLSKLKQLLSQGGGPAAEGIVALLDRYPAEQAEMLKLVEQRFGPLFRDEVTQTMSVSRGQGARDDAPRTTYHKGNPYDFRSASTETAIPTEESGRAVRVDRTRSKDPLGKGSNELAVYHVSASIADTDGYSLSIEGDYRLVPGKAELGGEMTYLVTDRQLVLTLPNGEVAYAKLHGEAGALLEVDQKLDPWREIHEASKNPTETGQVYIPATEGYLPTIFGNEGKNSLSAAASSSRLLDYDDPLRQLAAFKRIVQSKGLGDAAHNLRTAHERIKRIIAPSFLDTMRELEKHTNAREHYEDGDPAAIARAEDLLRDINQALGEIGSAPGHDHDMLVKMRGQLLEARDRARAAHAPEKSFTQHVVDFSSTPFRVAGHMAEGVYELGATIIDGGALGVDAFGTATGLWSYDWDPISKIGKASKNQDVSSGDVLHGIVFGIVDEWSLAIEHARNGDYSLLYGASVDTYLFADAAVASVEWAAVKAPELAAKASAAIANARVLLSEARIPTEIADQAAAIAKTLDVFVGSEGMQMSTAGAGGPGPKMPGSGGASLGEAVEAGRAVKLERAKSRAIDALKTRAPKGAGDNVAEVVTRLERMFGGDTKAATAFFKELELRSVDLERYMSELDGIVAANKLSATDIADALSRSLSGKVDPVAFMADLRAQSERNIPPEDVRAIAKDAVDGKTGSAIEAPSAQSGEAAKTRVAEPSSAPGSAVEAPQVPDHIRKKSTRGLITYRKELEQGLANNMDIINNPARSEWLTDGQRETFLKGAKHEAQHLQREIQAVDRELATRGGR